VAEVAGVIRVPEIIDGATMNEQLDEVTGPSRNSIIESRDAEAQPRISIEDDKGNAKSLPGSEPPARYNLPVGANITVNDGDSIEAGEVIARIPRETTKTKDITGGLPRVAELFEARKPKEHAVISEIEGVVSFGKDTKGKRKVVVTPEIEGKLRTDLAKEYLIAKGKHINVHAGDRVQAAGGKPAVGEPLLLGITKASLSTESFISASSFQETTKVLTEAAISGRVDYLRGLKENVIMGRLIPAGTGLTAYKHLDIEVETPVDEVEAAEEALAIASGAETAPPAMVAAEE